MENAVAMTWMELGFTRWPIAFSMIMILVLGGWSISQLAKPGAVADPRTKAWVDGVFFWSGFAAVMGLLGALVGVIRTFQAIEIAGEVTPTLVAGGVKVALLNSTVGFFLLGVGGVAWFLLQVRWRFVEARTAQVA